MAEKKKIDEKEQELLLQQWQTCVESANTVSQRRDAINGIFVTLSLAVVTCSTAFWDRKSIPILLVGVAICIAWLLYLCSLKRLNAAKYDVINMMEESLPCQPFSDEWKALGLGKRYVKGTTVERILPVAFIVLYAVMLIIVIHAG
ncbi:RipA family octameric membrane protein [Xiamenia xianingshaonis]|uniref:Small integral membrane protein n=1 Tax=Xiamenia xianingshaonis TaxID=2682776 RepID=A0A9E6MQ01_9ACTN|nr:hypothetical protein [Xiamenia xianingshaonis]NHM14936.1 hypothetical protein [Xiamenia xianingshaonis]QTU84257.1 hypothetical protein J7S26_07895 [Xiamenia xianingshaonis]